MCNTYNVDVNGGKQNSQANLMLSDNMCSV